jgi:hypothetical protein
MADFWAELAASDLSPDKRSAHMEALVELLKSASGAPAPTGAGAANSPTDTDAIRDNPAREADALAAGEPPPSAYRRKRQAALWAMRARRPMPLKGHARDPYANLDYHIDAGDLDREIDNLRAFKSQQKRRRGDAGTGLVGHISCANRPRRSLCDR